MSPNPQESANLVTFNEEILNGKLHFLCSVRDSSHMTSARTETGEVLSHSDFFCIFSPSLLLVFLTRKSKVKVTFAIILSRGKKYFWKFLISY